MSRLRSVFVLLAFALALAVGVPCATATDPFPATGVATLDSQHFEIHYTRDKDHFPAAYITQEKAGDVLGMAERAYQLYVTQWGYPAPMSPNASGLIDISIDAFCPDPGAFFAYIRGVTEPVGPSTIDGSVPRDANGGFCRWNGLTNPAAAPFDPSTASPGEIHLDATTGLHYHMIAHEVFHLVQLAMPAWSDQWLREATAEWAAFRAEDLLTPTDPDRGVNPDRTVDCVGAECGDTELDRNGYPGWMLFEYLSEQFDSNPFCAPSDPRSCDSATVHAVLSTANANGPTVAGTQDLANVLTTHSLTLEQFFNGYAKTMLTGGFLLDAIKGKLPVTQASVTTPDVSGKLTETDVAVNHLAIRFVALQHGAAADVRAPCYAATLALNIAIPAGVTSTPYYYPNTFGSTAQAFTVSGSTATLTVPWNTCSGSPDALIALPNDTWNPGLDGREFAVTGNVTVNLNAPASPASPSGGTYTGPVVAAPTTDPAPRLTLYAPEVLRVSSKTRVLRFVMFASGTGKLHAVLGPTDLGSSDLRAGNNDIRYTLPVSLVSALRKTASAGNVLALTSLSPSGTAGTTITRRVVIQTPAKKKPRR